MTVRTLSTIVVLCMIALTGCGKTPRTHLGIVRDLELGAMPSTDTAPLQAGSTYLVKCDFGIISSTASGTPVVGATNGNACTSIGYDSDDPKTTMAVFKCSAPNTAQTVQNSCTISYPNSSTPVQTTPVAATSVDVVILNVTVSASMSGGTLPTAADTSGFDMYLAVKSGDMAIDYPCIVAIVDTDPSCTYMNFTNSNAEFSCPV